VLTGPTLEAQTNSATEPVRAPLQLRMGREDAPANVVWGFFDPVAGTRVARMKAGRLARDFGKQGVFRVAWKPRAVLSDVELKIADSAGWQSAASQLADLFDSLGSSGQAPVLRELTVEFEDTGVRVRAPEAVASRNGQVLLAQARVGDGPPQPLILHLRGARAGQLEHLPNAPPSPAPSSP